MLLKEKTMNHKSNFVYDNTVFKEAFGIGSSILYCIQNNQKEMRGRVISN